MDVSGTERRRSDNPREPDRRSGVQRRDAFRVGMRNVPVYLDSPMQLFCELVDMSVLGARFDRELPCTPGIRIRFRIHIPAYGASPEPEELELTAEVVRVEYGDTGVRFVELDGEQARAVRRVVSERQRALLAALRNSRQGPLRGGRYWQQ